MNYNFGKCAEITINKIIVCKDKGTGQNKFKGMNPNQKEIIKVKVDKCLKINGKRCDWLLIEINSNGAHFIELKGHHLGEAFEQLKNSIKEIGNRQNEFISTNFHKKYAYAVIKRSPLDSNQLRNERVKFMRHYKTDLTVKCSLCTVSFS